MEDILPQQHADAACIDCCKTAGDDLHVFEATKTCLVTNPQTRLVHLHFGVPTSSDTESTQQAKFIKKTVVDQLYSSHPDSQFYVIADFGRLDDSTAPSKEALRLYAEVIKHPQTDLVMCHSVSLGMKSIIQVLSHTPLVKESIAVVDNEDEATAAYTQWADTSG